MSFWDTPASVIGFIVCVRQKADKLPPFQQQCSRIHSSCLSAEPSANPLHLHCKNDRIPICFFRFSRPVRAGNHLTEESLAWHQILLRPCQTDLMIYYLLYYNIFRLILQDRFANFIWTSAGTLRKLRLTFPKIRRNSADFFCMIFPARTKSNTSGKCCWIFQKRTCFFAADMV